MRAMGWGLLLLMMAPAAADAQDVLRQEPMPQPHVHGEEAAGSRWQLMQDYIVFAELNHQGGRRGGDEFVVPNWWMGMATRNTPRGAVTFTGMFSLDAVTVGKDGYRELFQTGEALNGRPFVDRQHPHDAFMQLAVVWHVPLNGSSVLTLAAAPVGEPALGPVAFMHRASAGDNPVAPLGHHLFDSTHISFGVITAAVSRSRWTVEGSLFNGREPDDRRWDFDFGRLDSVSAQVWFKPTAEWAWQLSTARLRNPEELEPGDIERSTASVAWTRTSGADVTAVTIAYGRNDSAHGDRNGVLVESLRRRGLSTVYARLEALQVETAALQVDRAERDPTFAFTLGGVRDVLTATPFEGGVGADVTLYRPPEGLRSTYGSNPLSFHLFFRLRPRLGGMGRMWNMRMSQPPSGHEHMAHQPPGS
jgi:hypothetical protein